jgi:pimeloyl-ACP methyl ester carboxylesterase
MKSFVLFAALCLACGACAGVDVRPANAPDLYDADRTSRLDAHDLSPRSRQTLRRLDLDGAYRRSPDEALARLYSEALQDPDPDVLFALAEGHYLRGRAAEGADNRAVGHYYLSAGFAYHFLFPEKPRAAAAEEAFDPRYRLACDLYNESLGKCLAAAKTVIGLDPSRDLQLAAGDGGTLQLAVVRIGFAWKPEEFGPLFPCSDYEPVGLENRHGGHGLGVPLIGSRVAPPNEGRTHYPPQVNFPVTAVLRFDGGLADLGTTRAGRMELYNPLDLAAIVVRGRRVPLESDLTTPLAYAVGHSDLKDLEFKGFLTPGALKDRTGIFLSEPYQPGKIPVVLVHGLLSSPRTWAAVYNDLLADPALREHFQFWAYQYPTGDPYLTTAAGLRRSLRQLRQDLDPGNKDPALGQMVVVGHSMGGLIAKLAAVDSGDTFWKEVSDQPLAGLKLKPETRAELQQVLYFERQPEIRRVIFIATPHHGSKLSPTWAGRLADHLVTPPRAMVGDLQDLAAADPALPARLNGDRPPTSVAELAPESTALKALAARPKPAGVHYHSIIGVTWSASTWPERLLAGWDDPGDGVVPYASAHIDDADSELVVDADHFGVHPHPRAIREVRRILLEHYLEVRKESANGVVPAVVGSDAQK